MIGAANARPAPSPAGRRAWGGRGPERGTPAPSPLFRNLPFSHLFQLPLPFPQFPGGERQTSLGFPPC